MYTLPRAVMSIRAGVTNLGLAICLHGKLKRGISHNIIYDLKE
jgi:hypothetical protein